MDTSPENLFDNHVVDLWSWLDPESIAKCMMVCTQWRDTIQSHPSIWSRLLCYRLPIFSCYYLHNKSLNKNLSRDIYLGIINYVKNESSFELEYLCCKRVMLYNGIPTEEWDWGYKSLGLWTNDGPPKPFRVYFHKNTRNDRVQSLWVGADGEPYGESKPLGEVKRDFSEAGYDIFLETFKEIIFQNNEMDTIQKIELPL